MRRGSVVVLELSIFLKSLMLNACVESALCTGNDQFIPISCYSHIVILTIIAVSYSGLLCHRIFEARRQDMQTITCRVRSCPLL